MVSALRIGYNGAWYADNNPMLHRKIIMLFARSLKRDDSGGYIVRLANRIQNNSLHLSRKQEDFDE